MNIFENLTLPRIKIINYAGEIIIAIISFLLSYGLFSTFGETFYLEEKYIPLSPTTFRFIIWIFIFLLAKNLFDYIFPSIQIFYKNKKYIFTNQDWPNKWVSQGGIKVSSAPSSLIIENSNSGCLLKRKWKNFEMKFDMMFESSTSYNRLGIIFRADNLENYFMLQLEGQKNNNGGCKLIINPHIRWQGKWDIYHDNTLLSHSSIKYDEFFRVKLLANKQIINLYINDQLAYEWILPSHVEAKYKQYETLTSNEYGLELNVVPIPFRLKYGKIGFRADRKEKAVIRGLEVAHI